MERRAFLGGAASAAATTSAVLLPGAGTATAEAATEATEATEATATAEARGGRGRDVVRFNIISDIQGDLNDFGKALDDMASVNPHSAGLGVAGDITPRGYDFEYAQVRERIKKHPHPRTVAWAIGNHEFHL